MIEKYIVMDGPDKGRVHDEAIAWDLAHIEYSLRKANKDQEDIHTTELQNQPSLVFSGIINTELLRLINDRLSEEAEDEFDAFEYSLNSDATGGLGSEVKFQTDFPLSQVVETTHESNEVQSSTLKPNSIRDAIDRAVNAEEQERRKKIELKVEHEKHIRQLSKEFVELMIENKVPSFEFTVDGENLGAAWLIREYLSSSDGVKTYEGRVGERDEQPGIAILENGDLHEFWGYSTSPQSSRLSSNAFGAYGSIVEYLSKIAKKHIAGEKID